jgi:hypothetical protein
VKIGRPPPWVRLRQSSVPRRPNRLQCAVRDRLSSSVRLRCPRTAFRRLTGRCNIWTLSTFQM